MKIQRMHLINTAMRVCGFVAKTFDHQHTPGVSMRYDGRFVVCTRDGHPEQWVNIVRVELLEPEAEAAPAPEPCTPPNPTAPRRPIKRKH